MENKIIQFLKRLYTTSNVDKGRLVISSSSSSSNPFNRLLLRSTRISFREILSEAKFFKDNRATGREVKLLQSRSNTRTEVRFATDSGVMLEMLLPDRYKYTSFGNGR